MQVAFGGVTMS